MVRQQLQPFCGQLGDCPRVELLFGAFGMAPQSSARPYLSLGVAPFTRVFYDSASYTSRERRLGFTRWFPSSPNRHSVVGTGVHRLQPLLPPTELRPMDVLSALMLRGQT